MFSVASNEIVTRTKLGLAQRMSGIPLMNLIEPAVLAPFWWNTSYCNKDLETFSLKEKWITSRFHRDARYESAYSIVSMIRVLADNYHIKMCVM